MFVKIGQRYINFDNVTFIDDQNGERYAIHFVNAEHQSLTFNNGVLRDSSYSDLRAWLKSQATSGAAAEQPLLPSPGLLPRPENYPGLDNLRPNEG